jgi:SNF2 family DNA or RNA helicase
MGLGKTIQAIGISWYFRQDWHLLVICPTTLALNWSKEIENWLLNKEHLTQEEIEANPEFLNSDPSEFIQIFMKSSQVSLAALKSAKVSIISYTLAVKNKDLIEKAGFQTIVADECHFLKNMVRVSI